MHLCMFVKCTCIYIFIYIDIYIFIIHINKYTYIHIERDLCIYFVGAMHGQSISKPLENTDECKVPWGAFPKDRA